MSRPLGLYLHVPFCTSRCGYCDFNTYTAAELGSGVRRDTFAEVLAQEIRMAAADPRVAGRRVETVFVGGGTPTLLGSDGLGLLLDSIRKEFLLAAEAEITTEANPDSVDMAMLAALRESGYNRISFGMQSAAPHVLQVLDRTHTPGASIVAAAGARAVGFEHVNLDLIYGTPGETDDDLRESVSQALSAGVDHVSAYALIIEEGTPISRRISRGELNAPDDDICADRYLIIDEMLDQAGLAWYEVSNWAAAGGECRHNLGYWRDGDWWGIGPGAHSHVDGLRWWNEKHPATYAAAVKERRLPQAGSERVSREDRRIERIMLGMRLAEGLPSHEVAFPEQIDLLVAEGLIVEHVNVAGGDRLVLTQAGRLLADAVVRRLAFG